MIGKIVAPWTAEQVAALNRYQESGEFHPFTCAGDHVSTELAATFDGWVCPLCDYRQDWAWQWMAEVA